MTKSRDAFRTISEVAELLDTPAHVLRFWESKFTQVKPVKRAGGRRYYRPGDIGLLAGIKKLLHDDGMTIKGVQKVLREQGVKHVSSLVALPTEEVGDALPDPIEDAPFAEVEQESATVLPFTAPQAASEAPPDTSQAETPDAVPEISEIAEPPDPAAEAPAEDAVVPDELPETDPIDATEPVPTTDLPDRVETDAVTDQEAETVPPMFSPGAADDSMTETAKDLPEPPSEPAAAAPLVEDRQIEQPYDLFAHPDTQSAEEPVTEEEAVLPDTEEAAEPEELPAFLTRSLDERAAPEAPEEAGIVAARPLPELPDESALPVPGPGILARLAHTDRLDPARAAHFRPHISALRALVSRRSGGAES